MRHALPLPSTPHAALPVRRSDRACAQAAVGGSAPGSVLWHGVELEDLEGLIESVTTDGTQVVSLLMSTHVKKEAVALHGLVAAQNNLAEHVKIAKQHPYRLAFALTVWDLD